VVCWSCLARVGFRYVGVVWLVNITKYQSFFFGVSWSFHVGGGWKVVNRKDWSLVECYSRERRTGGIPGKSRSDPLASKGGTGVEASQRLTRCVLGSGCSSYRGRVIVLSAGA